MDPRKVVRDKALRAQFVTYWNDHHPDVSDRPEIPPAKIQYWMMQQSGKKRKKRYPRPHALMKGMQGAPFNKSLDFGISLNEWCVSFRDNEDDSIVNLVDRCVITVWMHYISQMVRGAKYTDTCYSQFCMLLMRYIK